MISKLHSNDWSFRLPQSSSISAAMAPWDPSMWWAVGGMMKGVQVEVDSRILSLKFSPLKFSYAYIHIYVCCMHMCVSRHFWAILAFKYTALLYILLHFILLKVNAPMKWVNAILIFTLMKKGTLF